MIFGKLKRISEATTKKTLRVQSGLKPPPQKKLCPTCKQTDNEIISKSADVKPPLFLPKGPDGAAGLVFIHQSAHRRGKIRARAVTEERAPRRLAHGRRTQDAAATLARRCCEGTPNSCLI